MNICYFGTYEKDYPRNRLIINGLKTNGVIVSEVHEPFWELTRDKTGVYLNFINIVKLTIRLFFIYIRLFIKYLQLKPARFYFVGYIGNLDILFLRLLNIFNRKPIIYNPNISIYETLVEDRRIIPSASVLAKIIWFLDRVACKFADLIIIDTDEHLNYFKSEFKLNDKRFLKLYVGADEKIFKPVESDMGKLSGFSVFFFGKFIPLHGIDTIIKAAKLLENEQINFKLAGAGQIFRECNNLVSDLKLKNIELIGWICESELPQHISSADVCLGIFGISQKAARVIPNKVFQILACKKPLITADTPAAKEIFKNKETAILCKPGSPEELAKAILLLKNNKGLRDHIKSNGYLKFKEEFNPEVLGSILKKELINILQKT